MKNTNLFEHQEDTGWISLTNRAGDADGEGGVGWLMNRSNARMLFQSPGVSTGRVDSIVSTPSLQAMGNQG
ncbi:hypothetical protein V1477_020135 [Vespula maculifrons]|uniref:Uncharacterized protein n=4 Tax=Vespula TaxID=7451 RepID=A0A834NFM0_VESGE|nr:hypothetical protein HZH68_005573 [Vespula germanica]KAF7429794.1 hypothetical protein H0235_006192 [Vespula pensylvanica]